MEHKSRQNKRNSHSHDNRKGSGCFLYETGRSYLMTFNYSLRMSCVITHNPRKWKDRISLLYFIIRNVSTDSKETPLCLKSFDHHQGLWITYMVTCRKKFQIRYCINSTVKHGPHFAEKKRGGGKYINWGQYCITCPPGFCSKVHGTDLAVQERTKCNENQAGFHLYSRDCQQDNFQINVSSSTLTKFKQMRMKYPEKT